MDASVAWSHPDDWKPPDARRSRPSPRKKVWQGNFPDARLDPILVNLRLQLCILGLLRPLVGPTDLSSPLVVHALLFGQRLRVRPRPLVFFLVFAPHVHFTADPFGTVVGSPL